MAPAGAAPAKAGPARRASRRQLGLEVLEDRSMLLTFTVINTNDSGGGSLRQAILDANDTILSPGLDTIAFNIPGAGVKTIAPSFPGLPPITDPVTIDGYTQGSGTPLTADDATPNTLAVGDNAVLLVELSGASAGAGVTGLDVAPAATAP